MSLFQLEQNKQVVILTSSPIFLHSLFLFIYLFIFLVISLLVLSSSSSQIPFTSYFFLVNSILYFKFTPHHFQTNTSLPLCWFGEFGIRSTDKPRIDICLYSHLVCLTLHWLGQLLVQGNSVLITLGVKGSIFSELK